ncbi:hypothetical protein [Acinetobacter sp. HY1485]|uniref:hypothetical protein n=1 Tax=Acinetobacter sp. HY1485 TaxID=2970918 RepID=UPI003FA46950
MEAPFTPLGEASNHKPIAKLCSSYYPSRALSKILKLALVGYDFLLGVQSARAFFVRNTSMRSHIITAKLWRDTFECAGNLVGLSTNPLQLCHQSYLVVIGKAPELLGVHNHA